MNRTVFALIGGLAICGLVAWRLDGALATGLWTGYAFGAALGLSGALYQRHMLRCAPEKFLSAVSLGFLVKLAGALLGGLALRFTPAAEGVVDWQSFLVAYAAAAFLSVVAGSAENARVVLKGEAL